MLTEETSTFLAIAQTGHLTRAARLLHLTQPAVSARLRRLEEDLGVRLFHRTAKGMVLTEAGEVLQRHTEQAQVWLDDGRRALDALAGLSHGSLAIGAGATATSYLLPPLLSEFHSRYPGIRLHLREQGSAAVARGVLAGELDIGVVTRPVDDAHGALTVTDWCDDELQLIVPEGHPLSDHSTFRWSDLDGQPLVLFERGSAVRHRIDSALFEAQVAVRPVMELRSIASIRRMVAEGIGAAFISRHALPEHTGLVPKSGPRLTRMLALCRRADREPSPAAQAFMDLGAPVSETASRV